MNTKQLECFIQVADVLNFSVAAKKLYITQPSVSHQIQSLEEELGVQLFNRQKKTISLTVSGEIFYKDAKEILTREKVAKTRVKNTQRYFDTKIAVAFSANQNEKTKLPIFLSKYNKEYPEVYLYFRKFDSKAGIQNLLQGKMDLLFFDTKEVFNYRKIHSLTFKNFSFRAIVSASSPLTGSSTVTIEGFEGQYLILPEATVATVEMRNLIQYLQSQIDNLLIYYCDDIEVAIMLAQSEFGITLVPEFYINPAANYHVLNLDIPSEFNTIPYGIAWAKNRTTRAQQNLVDQLKSYIEEIF